MRNNDLFQKITSRFIALIFLLASFSIGTQIALAEGVYGFVDDSGLGHAADVAGFETGPSSIMVESIIARIIFIGLGLVGVIFFGLTLLAGFNWMIAQGNEEKVGKAKNSLLNSIIGLIITLAAYAISYLLLSYFS